MIELDQDRGIGVLVLSLAPLTGDPHDVHDKLARGTGRPMERLERLAFLMLCGKLGFIFTEHIEQVLLRDFWCHMVLLHMVPLIVGR